MTIDLDEFADRLRNVADTNYAVPIVEALVEHGVEVMHDTMSVDTGQLQARTGITYVGGTASRAEAEWQADTPYAGWHNYGTRHQAPNGFADRGVLAMEQAAEAIGGQVATQVERQLVSGGVANPRTAFRV